MIISITDFAENELPAIAKWRGDCDVSKYIRRGYKTLEEVGKWYREYFTSGANYLFGVLVDEKLIGYCTIEHIDPDNNKCELGIVIGEKDYWEKGIGGNVIGELLRRAFNGLHMHRVEAVIHGDNIASIKCFSRAGFHLDGRLRGAKYRDGRYVDLLLFSILDIEWNRKKGTR